jgi:hypothetical protein
MGATTPAASIVAMIGILLLHEPPPVTHVIDVVVPSQIAEAPTIAAGVVFTVTVCME